MGWYYNPPPPQQPRPRVIQPSVGQEPPRRTWATLAALVCAWPTVYDHTAYTQNVRPKLPLTLAVGQSPPIASRAAFYATRALWTDPTWTSQDNAPVAGIVPQAPWAQRVPIVVNDPARPFFGQTGQQYGYRLVSQIPGLPPQAPPVNAPIPGSNADLYSQRACWLEITWPAQSSGKFASLAPPPPVVNAPPIGSPTARTVGILAQWAPPVWPAQGFQDSLVQPPTGDDPPGFTTPPDLAPFFVEPWRAQQAAPNAGWNVPFVAPSSFPRAQFPYAVYGWWAPQSWPSQQAADGANFIAITYGAQPTPNSIAADFATRATWPDATWTVQTAAPVAVLVVPPVVNNPTPSGSAAFVGLRAQWIDATWFVQSADPVAGTIQTSAINNPTPTGTAALVALRAQWIDSTWSAQTAHPVAGTIQTAISNPTTPTSVAALAALRAQWIDASWAAQSAPAFASIAPAQIAAFQPWIACARAIAVRATWSETAWGVQNPAPVAALVQPVPTQPWNATALFAGIRSSWAELTWTEQSEPAGAAIIPPPRVDQPQPNSFAQLYTLRGLWTNPAWTSQSAFNPVSGLVAPLILTGEPRYIIKRLRARRWTISAVSYLQFEPMDPAEAVKLTFDFGPDLPTGILLSGAPSVSVSLLSGVDASPANIRNGAAGFDVTSTQVIVPVKGAASGNNYDIKVVQATTDASIVLALTGTLLMTEGA